MTELRVRTTGAVCRATLHEPDKLNPLGEEVRAALQALVDRLATDPDVRVLVLDGAGRAFSAGADLRQPPPTGGSWAERRRASGAWQRVLDGLEHLPQVTVARLHGPVVGGAALLAVACDIRVAADDVVLAIPELAIGIPLTWGGLPRLVREIGLPRARDLVMTGRTLGAEEALAWGLVTRVAPAAEIDAAVDAAVQALLAMPDAPLRMTKDALAAIGRDRAGMAAAWADPDLLAWSLAESERDDAARRYVRGRSQRSEEPPPA